MHQGTTETGNDMIAGRHIRRDWPEWVEWQRQGVVRTMCGKRSRPGLCGIPGVTQQDRIVTNKAGLRMWGWCSSCVMETYPYYLPPALTSDIAPDAIFGLHVSAMAELVDQHAFIEAKAMAVNQSWAKRCGPDD